MAKFYVTFGMKYALEPHQRFPGAHPDGWLVLISDSYDDARDLAFAHLESDWAFLYPEPEFLPHHHPRGEIGRISADTPVDIHSIDPVAFKRERCGSWTDAGISGDRKVMP